MSNYDECNAGIAGGCGACEKCDPEWWKDLLYVETCNRLAKAFAMMSLAMIASKPREFLERLPPGFRCELTDRATAARLYAEVTTGRVTVIVPKPAPFTFVIYRGTFGEMRAVYGLWIGRPATWISKRNFEIHSTQDNESVDFGKFLLANSNIVTDSSGKDLGDDK